MGSRREKDTLGDVEVPENALWGAQTQRAVENYPISGYGPFPAYVRAFVLVKKAAAFANHDAGRLGTKERDAIVAASDAILAGKHSESFVVDVFQAGAGTSHNMNANEVIANLANEILGGKRGAYEPINPNDHVNMAQSTNDVTPSAIRVAVLEMFDPLIAELEKVADVLTAKAAKYKDVTKAGRTHLQDAVPMTFGQEIGAWGTMLRQSAARLRSAKPELGELGIGGTAAGTGLNADSEFGARVCRYLKEWTGQPITPSADLFASMQSAASFLRASSAMRVAAVDLSKIANDIRLLVSGPRTGIGELQIPAVQPGSSIMPGKINPSIAEMVNQVCYQVIGNDTAVAFGAQAGQLELNVMMPGMAFALCFSATILTNATRIFRERCIEGMNVDVDRAKELLDSSPSLIVTALNPHIGYAKAAALVKRALAERRPLFDIAMEEKVMPEAELRRVLDPLPMTRGGVQ